MNNFCFCSTFQPELIRRIYLCIFFLKDAREFLKNYNFKFFLGNFSLKSIKYLKELQKKEERASECVSQSHLSPFCSCLVVVGETSACNVRFIFLIKCFISLPMWLNEFLILFSFHFFETHKIDTQFVVFWDLSGVLIRGC